MSPDTNIAAPASVDAPAKLNLFLRITGRREDGYHELDTLFFRLDQPCDTLTFTPGVAGQGMTLTCDIAGLAPEDNLAFKAYAAFAAATGFAPDLRLDITKRIPAGAGLGGGSTDAAAVLRLLNEQAGEKALQHDKLIALAAELGADIPFFLLDTPARATGIGDKLVPEPVDFSGLTLVVACPKAHVDTAWAYKAFDREKTGGAVSLTMAQADNNRPVPTSPPMFHNDFESVVFRAFPAIRAVKEELLRFGACAAAMSGSGASVFALFRSAKDAEKAADALAQKQVKTYTRRY